MQMLEASALNKAWGEKPCEHPTLEKEYHLGSATGDYACTACGKSQSGNDWNEQK